MGCAALARKSTFDRLEYTRWELNAIAGSATTLERYPGAMDDAGEYVPAELVGAERVIERRRREQGLGIRSVRHDDGRGQGTEEVEQDEGPGDRNNRIAQGLAERVHRLGHIPTVGSGS